MGKIINADCLVVLPQIPSKSIDLIITSPPYDNLRKYGDTKWNMNIFQQVANQLWRVLKSGGVVVWIVGDQIKNGGRTLTSFRQALYFQSIGFKIYDIIIYEKTGAGPPHRGRYFNAYDYMFILSKGRPKTVNLLKDKPNKWAGTATYGNVTRREQNGTLTNKGRKIIGDFGVRTNIWKYNNGYGHATKDKIAYEHPSIFPEKLVEDHITCWSNKGDLVLDPFGGSGTTSKVAQKLERKWILIEQSSKYCHIAEERLNALKG